MEWRGLEKRGIGWSLKNLKLRNPEYEFSDEKEEKGEPQVKEEPQNPPKGNEAAGSEERRRINLQREI